MSLGIIFVAALVDSFSIQVFIEYLLGLHRALDAGVNVSKGRCGACCQGAESPWEHAGHSLDHQRSEHLMINRT